MGGGSIALVPNSEGVSYAWGLQPSLQRTLEILFVPQLLGGGGLQKRPFFPLE